MEDAAQLLPQGYPCGTVVVAGFQERGRGRFSDRPWQSSPGQGLLFTLILDSLPEAEHVRLPLLAGLALARTLEGLFELEPEVKWPNDLLLGGRKVCGILCESAARRGRGSILVGVGLNCNQRELPPGLAGRATSLRLETGRRVRRIPILEGFLHHLKAGLENEGWREALLERLYGLGRKIELHRGSERVTGTLTGIAGDGALLIDGSPVYAGEIVIPTLAEDARQAPAP